MKVEIKELDSFKNEEFKFAVIGARYKNRWVFVRHKERTTWEIPGGHREVGEEILFTAKRELYEETGACDFEITGVADYYVERNNAKSWGRLFYAEIKEFGKLPDLEIAEVMCFEELPDNLTYPDIQNVLHEFLISCVA